MFSRRLTRLTALPASRSAHRGKRGPCITTAAILICFLLGGRLSHSAEQVSDSPFPQDLAFNHGVYPDAGSLATGHGEIDEKNSFTIHHRWIEAFENDFRTSTLATTVFASCQSIFEPVIPSGIDLKEVDIQYVVLDYMGRPSSSAALKVAYRREYVNEGWHWRRSQEEEKLSEFKNSLTQSDLADLELVSGFLWRFPGQPVVPYIDDAATVVRTSSLFLSAAIGQAELGGL